MNSHTEKFHKIAVKRGFKIVNVSALVNDTITRRKDIQSVRFHGHHIMTIPRKMYGRPITEYRDLLKNELPHYYDREHRLKNWELLIKRSGHLLLVEDEKKIDAKLWQKAL